MSDYRQMQELQEQRESEAVSALMKVAYSGCEREAEILAAQLGVYKQFGKELEHEGNC